MKKLLYVLIIVLLPCGAFAWQGAKPRDIGAGTGTFDSLYDTINTIKDDLYDNAATKESVSAHTGNSAIHPTVNALGTSTLPCTEGQLPKVSSGVWVCGTDIVGTSGDNSVKMEVVLDNLPSTGTAPGSLLSLEAFTLTEVGVVCDSIGSIVIDIWALPITTGVPTDINSITSTSPLTITSASYIFDGTLAGWVRTFEPNTMFKFNVDSASTMTGCTVIIKGTK